MFFSFLVCRCRRRRRSRLVWHFYFSLMERVAQARTHTQKKFEKLILSTFCRRIITFANVTLHKYTHICHVYGIWNMEWITFHLEATCRQKIARMCHEPWVGRHMHAAHMCRLAVFRLTRSIYYMKGWHLAAISGPPHKQTIVVVNENTCSIRVCDSNFEGKGHKSRAHTIFANQTYIHAHTNAHTHPNNE